MACGGTSGGFTREQLRETSRGPRMAAGNLFDGKVDDGGGGERDGEGAFFFVDLVVGERCGAYKIRVVEGVIVGDVL